MVTLFLYLKYIPGFLAVFFLIIFTLRFFLKKKTILDKKPYLYVILPLVCTLLLLSLYLITRATLAQYYFNKSLGSKSTKDIYHYQRLAIMTNPYLANYRRIFSQTNLLIANNIAAKVKTSEVEEDPELVEGNGKTSEVNKLSPQDRQTITRAVQAAIAEGKAAVRLGDQKAENWENLALIYQSFINSVEGAGPWAISAYQRAIILEPKNPSYRFGLAGIYYLAQRYDDSIRLLEQALNLKPDWPNAHYNLAWALYQKKDYARAAGEMQTVLNLLDPKQDKADFEKAKKDLEEFKLKLSAF